MQCKTTPNKLRLLVVILQGREISQKVVAIGNYLGNHLKVLLDPSDDIIRERTAVL